jgi:hypothetical protein
MGCGVEFNALSGCQERRSTLLPKQLPWPLDFVWGNHYALGNRTAPDVNNRALER